uniref:Uncharacterized protein n=1 Tax=Glossina brevipalpis TaxID=37001 RepID=A0A1A9WQG7_9MUSC
MILDPGIILAPAYISNFLAKASVCLILTVIEEIWTEMDLIDENGHSRLIKNDFMDVDEENENILDYPDNLNADDDEINFSLTDISDFPTSADEFDQFFKGENQSFSGLYRIKKLEVWGREEELMRQHENRLEKRQVTKICKFNKQMKELRMEMRSSLHTKRTKGPHVHQFGNNTYNEEDDTYTHTCLICSFTETYEKM